MADDNLFPIHAPGVEIGRVDQVKPSLLDPPPAAGRCGRPNPTAMAAGLE